jgi:hypothetical protein
VRADRKENDSMSTNEHASSDLLRVGGHWQGILARFDNLSLSKLFIRAKLPKKERRHN